MAQQVAVKSPFAAMAARLDMDAGAVKNLMINTLMQAKKDRNGNLQQVSEEELMVFMSIANEYKLSPLSKEVYAFNNRGAIQPIVSVDGWLKIINSHPQFDGMEFQDHMDGGKLVAITCRIYRKDRTRATETTERMDECQGTSEPWKKWPARMLRHKATIQAARYAFGLSGIVDPDEAERMQSTVIMERDITPAADITPALQAIQNAQSMDELKAAGIAANQQHPGQRQIIESEYRKRQGELKRAHQEAVAAEALQEQEPAIIENTITEAEAQAAADLGWTDDDLGLTEGEQDDIPGI